MSLSGLVATSVEEAYAYYLWKRLFLESFSSAASSAVFEIQGRQAVVVLQQTNLERATLRHLWALVDPQTKGSLQHFWQWLLLLRLVALAQSGCPTTLLEQNVSHTNHQPPLAAFPSVSIPPLHELQQYHFQYQQRIGMPTSHNMTYPTYAHAHAHTPAHALPTFTTSMPQTTATTTATTNTIPGPSLPRNIITQQTTTGSTMTQDTALGTILSTSSLDNGESPSSEAAPSTLDDMDPFAAMGPLQDAPLPSLAPNSSMTQEQQPTDDQYHQGIQESNDEDDEDDDDDDDDDFGDFNDAVYTTNIHPHSVGSEIGTQESKETYSSPSPALDMDPFGSIGPPLDAPLPTLSPESMVTTLSQSQQNQGVPVHRETLNSEIHGDHDHDDFGDFTDAIHTTEFQRPVDSVEKSGATAPLPTLDTDPFAAIGPAMDAPLPSLSQDSMVTEPSLPDSHHGIRATIGDDEDDFGDFTDTIHTAIIPQHSVGSRSSTEEAQVSETLQEDPFGTIGPALDAPLPTLSQVSMSSTESQPKANLTATDEQNHEHNSDDDDFGDFSDALHATTVPQHSVSPIKDSKEITLVSSLDVDPFDAMGAVLDAPLPSLSQDSMFTEHSESGAAHSSHNVGLSSHFGGFTEDVPITSDTITQTHMVSTSIASVEAQVLHRSTIAQTHVTDDNQFNANAYQQSFGLDALDSLGPLVDAPLPSLGQLIASVSVSRDKPVANHLFVEKSEQIVVPIPSQETISHENPGLDNEHIDSAEFDFGDFEGFSGETSNDMTTPVQNGSATNHTNLSAIDGTTIRCSSLPTDDRRIPSGDIGDFSGDASNTRLNDEKKVSDLQLTQVSFNLNEAHLNDNAGIVQLSKENASSAFRDTAESDVLETPIDMGHVDSAYFSTRTQSGFSSYEDTIEFETNDDTRQYRAEDRELNDPFAAFEDISSPAPALHAISRSDEKYTEHSSDVSNDFMKVECYIDGQTDDTVASSKFMHTLSAELPQFETLGPAPKEEAHETLSEEIETGEKPNGTATDDFSCEHVDDPEQYSRAPSRPLSDNGGISDDDFGDFGGFETSTAVDAEQTIEKDVSTSFGDFEGVATRTAYGIPSNSVETNDEFEDFGDFEDARDHSAPQEESSATPSATVPPESEKLAAIRDRISELASKLPVSLRCKVDGSVVDYGSVFEGNIGMDAPLSPEREARAKRCVLLLMKFTTSEYYNKLVSTHWSSAMSVIKEEIMNGLQILSEAVELSTEDLAKSRQPLQTYMYGLGEFIRISRSITATIGDLLLLSSTALFTVDTVTSSWQDLAFLHEALEAESLWKKCEEMRVRLGLIGKDGQPHYLESLNTMRSMSSMHVDAESWDNFTLQPIGSECTKTAVHFGKNLKTMACTGNFLANKCPFFTAPMSKP